MIKLLSIAVVRKGVSLCWALASELFVAIIYVLWYIVASSELLICNTSSENNFPEIPEKGMPNP